MHRLICKVINASLGSCLLLLLLLVCIDRWSRWRLCVAIQNLVVTTGRAGVHGLHDGILLTLVSTTPTLRRLTDRVLGRESAGRCSILALTARTNPLVEQVASLACPLLMSHPVLIVGQFTDSRYRLLVVPARLHQDLAQLVVRILRTELLQELDHVLLPLSR